MRNVLSACATLLCAVVMGSMAPRFTKSGIFHSGASKLFIILPPRHTSPVK